MILGHQYLGQGYFGDPGGVSTVTLGPAIDGWDFTVTGGVRWIVPIKSSNYTMRFTGGQRFTMTFKP